MIQLDNKSKKGGHNTLRQQINKGGHNTLRQQIKEIRTWYTLTTNQRKEVMILLDNNKK